MLGGLRVNGIKEVVGLSNGSRESSEPWADLRRDFKRRGIRAPVPAVGGGALRFWQALGEVFPDTREQRCWWRKIGNVLADLPESVHRVGKPALTEICNADDQNHAPAAAEAFLADHGSMWPETVAQIPDDLEVLPAFDDDRAERWMHRRTTNPIGFTFATVRVRQRVTKSPGSRAARIAEASRLPEAARARRCDVNAPQLVALLRSETTFEKGVLAERPDTSTNERVA